MLFLGFCLVPTPSPVLCLLVLLVLVGVRVVGLLGLDEVDEFLEVLRHDRAVGARALDFNDVFLVDLVLLHQLGCGARDLALPGVFVVRVGLGGRLQVLDVLEKHLAFHSGARHLSDVQPVVATELLRARGGVHLGFLGALSELLEVLDRDLVVGSRALETVRYHDALGLGEVLRRLAGEARDLLLLRLLRQLLREVALGGEEVDRGVAVGRLVLEHLVDDHGEGLRGGRHECCCRCRGLLAGC